MSELDQESEHDPVEILAKYFYEDYGHTGWDNVAHINTKTVWRQRARDEIQKAAPRPVICVEGLAEAMVAEKPQGSTWEDAVTNLIFLARVVRRMGFTAWADSGDAAAPAVGPVEIEKPPVRSDSDHLAAEYAAFLGTLREILRLPFPKGETPDEQIIGGVRELSAHVGTLQEEVDDFRGERDANAAEKAEQEIPEKPLSPDWFAKTFHDFIEKQREEKLAEMFKRILLPYVKDMPKLAHAVAQKEDAEKELAHWKKQASYGVEVVPDGKGGFQHISSWGGLQQAKKNADTAREEAEKRLIVVEQARGHEKYSHEQRVEDLLTKLDEARTNSDIHQAQHSELAKAIRAAWSRHATLTCTDIEQAATFEMENDRLTWQIEHVLACQVNSAIEELQKVYPIGWAQDGTLNCYVRAAVQQLEAVRETLNPEEALNRDGLGASVRRKISELEKMIYASHVDAGRAPSPEECCEICERVVREGEG